MNGQPTNPPSLLANPPSLPSEPPSLPSEPPSLPAEPPSLPANPPALLQDGAFVIQLRDDTSFATGHVSGRVEHVRSGSATSFQSLEALVAFMSAHAGGKLP